MIACERVNQKVKADLVKL